MRIAALLLAVLAFAAPAAEAKTFLSRDEALALAFPKAKFARETFFLSPEQRKEIARRSGVEMEAELVIRYRAVVDGKTAGWAYFDAHRVRTLPETLMIVVGPETTIERIEIVAFAEPEDYLPRPRWLDQFEGRKLDDELSLRGAIRPITGASLSGRAVVSAARRTLALHEVLESGGAARRK
ncbi:MAG: FMN-binding protein [Thermoanaerobaculia bacterium]